MSAATLVDSIGWTLLHFSWQGALIGLETALALFILRNKSAETRYLVACTGLLLCLAWPAAELVARLHHGASGAAGFTLVLAGDVTAAAQEHGWRAMVGRNLTWIVGAWGLCALLMALRMLAGLRWIRHATDHGEHAPMWQARLDRLAAQAGLKAAIRLRVVAHLASPVTAGWWRPVVLVPAALVAGMPPHVLEALLAHELAHVRRQSVAR